MKVQKTDILVQVSFVDAAKGEVVEVNGVPFLKLALEVMVGDQPKNVVNLETATLNHFKDDTQVQLVKTALLSYSY